MGDRTVGCPNYGGERAGRVLTFQPTPTPEPTHPTAVAVPSPMVTTPPTSSIVPWSTPSPAPSRTRPAPFLVPTPTTQRSTGCSRVRVRATGWPVAVMVDDNVQARPQYGINAASIVYQAPADGGEDRYMFVYQEQRRNGSSRFVAADRTSSTGRPSTGPRSPTTAATSRPQPTCRPFDLKVLYNVDALVRQPCPRSIARQAPGGRTMPSRRPPRFAGWP